jgi:hypothetical protein
LNPEYAPGLVWGVVLAVFVVVLLASAFQKRRGGRPRARPGPGAYGAVYDLLNQDKRNAIELIVEEKAGARDPEDAEGKPTAGSDK